MTFWTGVNLVLTVLAVVGTILYEVWRYRRRQRQRPHALLRIHIDQLAGERHPDMVMTYLSVYTAVPPPGEQGMPSQWIYFDFLVSGFDIWRLRQLLTHLGPEEQFLIVRCSHGPRVMHVPTGASSTLQFIPVPKEMQTVAPPIKRKRRW